MLRVQRRPALGVEAASGELRHRHRMKERTRRGRADLLRLLPREPREDAQRVHVRMLALARPHADGRETLEQLDVVEAFLHGVREVLELQVFIEVDEILALRMRHDRPRMRWRFRLRRRRDRSGAARFGTRPAVERGQHAGAAAILQLAVEGEDAVHASAGKHARRATGPARTARSACHSASACRPDGAGSQRAPNRRSSTACRREFPSCVAWAPGRRRP